MEVVLTIAGSDSVGGAGIQADIKSAHYHGVYISTAITAVTAQNTLGVQGIEVLPSKFVTTQIKSVLDDFDVKVIKIGMLGSKELIKEVKNTLSSFEGKIILDPVAISRAGSRLLEDDAIEELKSLFEMVYLITPNKYESKLFFDVSSEDEIKNIQNETNILFKGIIQEQNSITDILLKKDATINKFTSLKANENNTHGTGCSYSASIAALLAKGKSLEDSITLAKEYIYNAIKQAPNLGAGNGPINHILKD